MAEKIFHDLWNPLNKSHKALMIPPANLLLGPYFILIQLYVVISLVFLSDFYVQLEGHQNYGICIFGEKPT